MNRHMLLGLAVLGVCVQATAGSAETLEPSAADVSRPAPSMLSSEAIAFAPGTSSTVLAYRRTPRRTYYPPSARVDPGPPPEREPQGWLTLRGGGYDSEKVNKDDWTVGLKAVGNIGAAVRMGATADLIRRENSDRSIVTEFVDASGNVVRSELTTAESESNLIPVMAVAEIVFPTPFFKPYAGVAGGWEFLNVKAVNYATGIGYDANYDGPGWQLYGGVALAFAKKFQMTAEVFHNEATVDRHVVDPITGAAYEERVDVDGMGLRGGLSFAF